MTATPSRAELEAWVHASMHVLHPERHDIVGCWEGFGDPCHCPDWAADALDAGQSPSAWCPVVNPALASRVQ